MFDLFPRFASHWIDTSVGKIFARAGGRGPAPVFAQAAGDRHSRFTRVLILPRALAGNSSLQHVNKADYNKPRSQQHKIFVDAPIGFEAARK